MVKNLRDRLVKEPEGLLYIPNFLSLNEQGVLLHQLQSLTYIHDKFRGRLLKRAYAQFGYSYVSTGRKIQVAPMIPPFLQIIIKKASPYYPNEITFTQCIVTYYPIGAGIGWHTDAPQFGNYICAVSLSAEARLQFSPNSSKKVSYEVKVSPGSLYLLQGLARWNHQHQVVPVKQERYSLTFRYLAHNQ